MSALLLVDVQNDFLPPQGSLAVPSGDEIIPNVLSLLSGSYPFQLVVASQDHHPRNHVSFASSHSDRNPFESIKLVHPVTKEETRQDLWPDHCVQGTRGVEFEERVSKELKTWIRNGKGTIVKKGEDSELDAYSAFAKPLKTLLAEREQGQAELESPLTTVLKGAKINRIFVVGLATDYCVRASVLSALEEASKLPAVEKWEVYVVKEAVRGVHPEREEEVLRELESRGARIVSINGPELASLRSQA